MVDLPEYEYKPSMDRRHFDRRCFVCEKEFPKADLRAKRVQFMEMGSSGKMVRSRVVAWLCIDCMENDPDFLREEHRDSPAFRGATQKPKECYVVVNEKGDVIGTYKTLAVANLYWQYGWPPIEKRRMPDTKKKEAS